MSGKPLHLRCKSKAGQQEIKQLQGHDLVQDLCTLLVRLTGIPRSQLRVLSGYPPRALDLHDPAITLEALGVKSGDVLHVEQMAVIESAGSTSMPTSIKGDAILMRHVVPADNSCLFNSIAFCISGGKDLTRASTLRQMIASAVASDPETYNDAILGKSNAEYCQWILSERTWGGAIEVSILSKYYNTEIVVVDTQHVLLNRFGESESYTNRILLIYDGIHYDPLVLESISGNNTVLTVFPVSDELILHQALEIAREAKASRQFTDLSNFQLRCLTCNQGFESAAAAQQHAKATTHINFGEINPN